MSSLVTLATLTTLATFATFATFTTFATFAIFVTLATLGKIPKVHVQVLLYSNVVSKVHSIEASKEYRDTTQRDWILVSKQMVAIDVKLPQPQQRVGIKWEKISNIF